MPLLHNRVIIIHNEYIKLHNVEFVMIKVLKKAFDIIEFISRHNGQPVLPAEIVEKIKLNQATSIRILKDLVELGYLEQISRQKGYVLGPMSFWVAGGKKYKNELSRRADPFILECARESGQSVLLATNLVERRFILAHYNMNPHFNVDVDEPWYEDIYVTATGRILMAYMPEKDLDILLRKCGLPEESIWQGAGTREGLNEELRKIRESGLVSFVKNQKSTLFIMSRPVFKGSEFVAALGMSVPLAELDQKGTPFYLECLKECARKISAEISIVSSIG